MNNERIGPDKTLFTHCSDRLPKWSSFFCLDWIQKHWPSNRNESDNNNTKPPSEESSAEIKDGDTSQRLEGADVGRHKLIHSLFGERMGSKRNQNRIFTSDVGGYGGAIDVIDWMVLSSDTFSILCDINCHRWLVWLINHTGLYPHLYIPSTEHFTFGSVHDVSHRIHQSEQRFRIGTWWWLRRAHFFGDHQLYPTTRSLGSRTRTEYSSSPNKVTEHEPSSQWSKWDHNQTSGVQSRNDTEFESQLEADRISSLDGISFGAGAPHHWMTTHFAVSILFFCAVSLRYVLHLGYIMLRQRSIEYFWAPLLVAVLTTTGSTLTAVYVYAKKGSIEDLIISSASFLKPLKRWQRILLIKLVPQSYFVLHMFFLLVDIVSCWRFVHDSSSLNSDQTVRWHQYQALPFISSKVSDGQSQLWTMNIGTRNTVWPDRPLISEPLQYDNNRSVPVSMAPTRSSTWTTLLYMDLVTRIYVTYGLVLIKVFYLSLTLVLVLKCVQLGCETGHRDHSFQAAKAQHQLHPHHHGQSGHGQSSHSHYPHHLSPHHVTNAACSRRSPQSASWSNQENERLSILTQVLLDNIRQYDQIFASLLLIWLVMVCTSLIGVAEFYACYHRVRAVHSIVPPDRWWLDRWLETVFQASNIATKLADIVIFSASFLTIRLYRRKLLTN